MMLAVIKLDICKSKVFTAQREKIDPSVRTVALKKLLSVSQKCFPGGDQAYPDGSFYKADGDAVWFVLEKPTVALRAAMEFMNAWYHEATTEFPDCRSFLMFGSIDRVNVPGKVELTGLIFEQLSTFEKGVRDGAIFVSQHAMEAVDPTMAKFEFYSSIKPEVGQSVNFYLVNYLDARTVSDSSLVHALFVAHPKAKEARNRVFELLLVQHLMENKGPSNYVAFEAWSKKAGYPLLARPQLEAVVKGSEFVEASPDDSISVSARSEASLREAQREFNASQARCVELVTEALVEFTERDTATAGVHVSTVIEAYLCAIFGEIRIVANYFRDTCQLFDSTSANLERYDHVLRRCLPEAQMEYFSLWKQGFLTGLRRAAEDDNTYIAAVFHNVLAAYYVNRSQKSSAYQVNRLKERKIYLDTNVLYSLRVPASQFHEITLYFVDRLRKLGVDITVAPITVQEFEEALAYAERMYNLHRDVLVERNPWLYQEFMGNRSRYLDSMSVCHTHFSILKGDQLSDDTLDQAEKRLETIGLKLERKWTELDQNQADKMWNEHKNWMTSDYWPVERYWEFLSKDFPDTVKRHDMTCIYNLKSSHERLGKDALGPRLLFVTVDSKLYRLSRHYPFIVTPEQLLEFLLPYLFLSDVPVVDAEAFPNRLLGAKLGTLLVKRPPSLADIVGAYFCNPSLLERNPRQVFHVDEETAKTLNDERFAEVVRESRGLEESDKAQLIGPATEAIEALVRKARNQKQVKALENLSEDLQTQINDKEKLIEKLQRTISYWKQQARRKPK